MKYLFSAKVVVIYTFLVVFLSVFPFKEPPAAEISFLDKIIHVSMYTGLAFLAGNTSFLKKRRHFKVSAFFYAVLLGVILELAQFFLPYRSFELADIGCNSLGGLLGVLFLRGNL